MEMYTTIVYVVADEVLRLLNVKDDPQCKMTNAEVMAFAIVSARFFSANHRLTRYLLKQLKLFPEILSNSRLNRRVRNIPWVYWIAVFRFLSFLSVNAKDTCHFAVDSFPVDYCQKNRIDKRKNFLDPGYIGFAASKKRYFCGIKVHMVVTNQGRPVEMHFRPGSESDINILWKMELDIPAHSTLYADGAYNCFDLEDVLKDENITLLAKRGVQSKNRVRTVQEEKLISSKRQIIETAFSSITALFPKSIKASTEEGFLRKVFCFVLAYSASFLCNTSLG